MSICVICWENCTEPKLNCLCTGEGNGIVHIECLKKMTITKCPQCRAYLRDEFERRMHELFAIVLLFLFKNKGNPYNNAIDRLLWDSETQTKIHEFNEMIIANVNVHCFSYSETLGDFKISCSFEFNLNANRYSRYNTRKTNDLVFFTNTDHCRLAQVQIQILNQKKPSRFISYIKKLYGNCKGQRMFR
jgi:hypothetical protein